MIKHDSRSQNLIKNKDATNLKEKTRERKHSSILILRDMKIYDQVAT